MSYVQLSEGGFQVVWLLACGPGCSELSKSDSVMASQVLAFSLTSPSPPPHIHTTCSNSSAFTVQLSHASVSTHDI